METEITEHNGKVIARTYLPYKGVIKGFVTWQRKDSDENLLEKHEAVCKSVELQEKIFNETLEMMQDLSVTGSDEEKAIANQWLMNNKDVA